MILWAIILFATIPFARTIQEPITQALGRSAFGYIVITVIVLVVFAAVFQLRHQWYLRKANVLWIVACGAVLVAYTIRLWRNPVEAIHFIQYGVMAGLFFYAFSWRHHNKLIYIAVVLATAIVGVVDEAIQWLTPKRVWGLSDITVNTLAAIVIAIGIAKGFQPTAVNSPMDRASLSLVVRLMMALLFLLILSFANTPAAIQGYSQKFPVLSFLEQGSHVMVEFGYAYRDDETGLFRSRFSPQEIRAQDRRRAVDAAAKLDAAPDFADYLEFIQRYSPFSDPFLHEMRVHLNRRDHYLWLLRQEHRGSGAERRQYLTNAWFENRIVEKYFSETLAKSSFLLPAATVEWLGEQVDTDVYHESTVSKHLITRFNRTQLLLLLTLMLLLCLMVDVYVRRKTSP